MLIISFISILPGRDRSLRLRIYPAGCMEGPEIRGFGAAGKQLMQKDLSEILRAHSCTTSRSGCYLLLFLTAHLRYPSLSNSILYWDSFISVIMKLSNCLVGTSSAAKPTSDLI